MAQRIHHLQATDRQGSAHTIRRRGLLPAVLYGHGAKNRILSLDQKSFIKVFKETGHTTLVNVTLEGDISKNHEYKALIRGVQLHPVKGDILHVDLYQVRMDEVIRARVPLVFSGEAPAVRDLGGVLVRNMDEVELEALPNDLPHDIEVDITALTEFDAPARIKDLQIPKKVKLLHEPDEVVVLVQPPRTEEELEAELAEEVTEDVESVEGIEEKEEETADGAEEQGEGQPTESAKGAQESKES